MGPNDKRWEENTDIWCRAMTESNDNKKLYQKYRGRTNNPMPYIKWLKGKKYDTSNPRSSNLDIEAT